ncbi:MAG TPA: hypothetical protein VGU66_09000 [Candidatus Elarobacter sp.]|nr:hypothetical protein [Candidatus Elarobacter sp.]
MMRLWKGPTQARIRRHLLICFTMLFSATLASCGGGSAGGGGGNVPVVPSPSSTPVPTVAPQTVSGSVNAIPQGSYGANASPTGVIVNATMVIGSTAILGATAPSSAPAGDVIVTTDGSGNFTATPPVGPAAPTSPTIVLPANNVAGATVPAKGYYVSIFAAGTDGKSAGAPLPYHGFVAAGSGLTFRVTTASNDEAAFLAQVNSNRASQAGLTTPLIFDELAVEAARQHVAEMLATSGYNGCHYNASNVGPNSRYALLGALGSDIENIGGYGHTIANYNGAPQTEPSNTSVWQSAEAGWVSEKATNGSHWVALSRPNATWAGVAVASKATMAGTNYDYEAAADLEVIAAGDTSTFSATNAGCPAGITANNS